MRITLCGSAKFEEEFHQWNEKLTLAGHVVYDLAVHPSRKEDKNWYGDNESEVKTALDLAHFMKISNSDAILVLNVNGYIGFSTKREIKWASMNNKKIFWLEKPKSSTPASELASFLV